MSISGLGEKSSLGNLTSYQEQFISSSSFICGDDGSTSGLVKCSSLGNKELRKMICHMKYIFVWIFLIPQPTGSVVIWDFVLIFPVFTFFFSYLIRSVQPVMLFKLYTVF